MEPSVTPPAPRRSYALWVELDVEVASEAEFAVVAMDWLDEGSRRYLGTARGVLDGDLNPAWKEPDDAPDAAWGPPNSIWGRLSVARTDTGVRPRTVKKPASGKGWRWLEEQLRRPPWLADVKLEILDGNGQPSVDGVGLEIRSEEHSPGWIRLCSRFSSRAFAAPVTGTENQQRWLDLMREYADRLNPSHGQIGVEHALGETTLEDRLPPNYGRNSPMYTVGESRQFLRGYGWLTIVPEELAGRVGGVHGLASTGVFAEVAALSAGGVWLLATTDFREYELAHAHRLFSVLAPILRPGLPRRPNPHDKGPFLLAYEDAVSATDPDRDGS
jgi:hypothetical protein